MLPALSQNAKQFSPDPTLLAAIEWPSPRNAIASATRSEGILRWFVFRVRSGSGISRAIIFFLKVVFCCSCFSESVTLKVEWRLIPLNFPFYFFTPIPLLKSATTLEVSSNTYSVIYLSFLFICVCLATFTDEELSQVQHQQVSKFSRKPSPKLVARTSQGGDLLQSFKLAIVGGADHA